MPLATTHVLEGGYNRDQLALVTEIRDHLARIAPYDTPSAQSEDAPPRNERAGDAPFDTGGRRSRAVAMFASVLHRPMAVDEILGKQRIPTSQQRRSQRRNQANGRVDRTPPWEVRECDHAIHSDRVISAESTVFAIAVSPLSVP